MNYLLLIKILNYLETAKREIYEETGIKYLEYIKDLGSYNRYKIYQTHHAKNLSNIPSKLNKFLKRDYRENIKNLKI